VELLHAVQRQRLVIQVELVGKQLGTGGEKWQVSDGKDANHADALTMTWPVERTVAPVLESSDETVFVIVCLRLTCNVTTHRSVTEAAID